MSIDVENCAFHNCRIIQSRKTSERENVYNANQAHTERQRKKPTKKSMKRGRKCMMLIKRGYGSHDVNQTRSGNLFFPTLFSCIG